MSTITLDLAIGGDVLALDVIVNDVPIFRAGTVLTEKRIQILKELHVQSVVIENRQRKYTSKKETFDNIDKRFSYVEDIPIMNHIKSWMKDVIANRGMNSEKEI